MHSITLITNLVRFMPALLTSAGLLDIAMLSMDHLAMEPLQCSLTAQLYILMHVSYHNYYTV